ncbi:MAG: helix-turn-helix transcriptional regulator [Chloroflexi bacterium]|nr:MAG: helix-turn-helix transcriptional regulator [Chloroflexota bacterium]
MTIHAMAAPQLVRARRQFVRLLHRGLDLAAFLEAADRTLVSVLPFDDSCWLTLDPATLLPTSHFTREHGIEVLMALAANEFLEDDLNKFADLARAKPPVGTLYAATQGDLHRSPRFTKVLAPYGHEDGDELRAVFMDGDSAWGCVALHRHQGRFHANEVALIADIGGYIAEGIRRAILTTALGGDDGTDPPGLILLREDDSVESLTPAASFWIGEILDSTADWGELPLIVASVAHRARQALAERTQEVAQARVPRRAGGWLILDASLMGDDPTGRVGVIVHPASAPQISGLIAEAYGLSKREREVTRLVLNGLSTREISERLTVSPYTVQDHLKAVFDKVGVRSRRELVAQLFLQHYAPRLQGGAKVGPDGWFAEERVAATSSQGSTASG